jgi:hypothetical protein
MTSWLMYVPLPQAPEHGRSDAWHVAAVRPEVGSEVVDNEGTKWHMTLLNRLARCGPKVNRQLFYFTMAARASRTSGNKVTNKHEYIRVHGVLFNYPIFTCMITRSMIIWSSDAT